MKQKFNLYTIIIVFLCSLITLTSVYADGTGGTISYDGLYTVHTFLTNGTFTLASGSLNATVLVVAGGGGGSGARGSGGGAGGLLYNTSFNITNATYPVIIGYGGAGNAGGGMGLNGTNSSFSTLIAKGGGGAGFDNKGYDGGSGGGSSGAGNGGSIGLGLAGQGNNGGLGQSGGAETGGGGGGANNTATAGNLTNGGNGGNGKNYSINGTNTYYAGGGGGGGYLAYTPGVGGLGGGGSGGASGSNSNGDNGVNGTGGGGGGGHYQTGNGAGGNGGTGIVIIRYLSTTSPIIYNITINTTPSSINTSSVGLLKFNASVTPNGTSNATMTLYVSTNTTANNGCAIFEQNVCVNNGEFIAYNMSRINNNTYNYSLYESKYFPAYYAFNENYVESTTHNTSTVYNHNYVKFNITNFSTTVMYEVNLEMDIQNQTGSGNLLLYYCNSSYVNTDPAVTSGCYNFDVFTVNNHNNHTHPNNNSDHYVVPLTTGNVSKTQQSYIILVSGASPPNAWLLHYVTNSSYNNASFQVGDFNTWTSTNKIFDMHIHQFAFNDSVRYYATYSDGSSGTGTSNTSILYFNKTVFPPSGVTIYQPVCNQTYVYDTTGVFYNGIDIFINHSTSSVTEPQIVYYTSFIQSVGFPVVVYSTPTTDTNYTYTFPSGSIVDNAYAYFGVISSQEINGINYTDTSLLDCYIYLCTPTWTRTPQGCIGGVRLINYTDTANCNTSLYVPTDNGHYEDCSTVPANITIGLDPTLLMIILIMVLCVVCMVLGAFVSEHFFIMSSFLFAMLATIFIYHTYDTILVVVSFFMMFLCGGLWVLLGKRG